jgi:aryl-alcohol dehydrogenase-like predicted oxidoreductase
MEVMMISKNQFGKTGHQSSRTLFGAAALWSVTQAEADRVLELLLEYGVNHIDVAASYGDAELRVGPWMEKYRSDFFLASKTGERTYEKAREEIHRSLERLRTDHLDLIQLHAVVQDEELEVALGPGGALEAAIDARAEGLVRFIGITSHTSYAPLIHLRALERFDFTSVLLPFNYPMMQIPKYAEGFNRLAAICEERGVAVQTIKSICRRPWPENAEHFASCWYEPLAGQADLEKAVGYVFGRPQLFLNTVGDVKYLARVLEAASKYTAPPSDGEMKELSELQEMVPLWPESESAH